METRPLGVGLLLSFAALSASRQSVVVSGQLNSIGNAMRDAIWSVCTRCSQTIVCNALLFLAGPDIVSSGSRAINIGLLH